VCLTNRVRTLAAHRRARLNEAQTLHQFFRDIDDEEAWIKYVTLVYCELFYVVHLLTHLLLEVYCTYFLAYKYFSVSFELL